MIDVDKLNSSKNYWFTAVYFTGSGTNRLFSSILKQEPVEVKLSGYKPGDTYVSLKNALTGVRVNHPRYYNLTIYSSWGDQFIGQYLFETKEEAIEFFNRSIDLEKQKLKECISRKEKQLEKIYI